MSANRQFRGGVIPRGDGGLHGAVVVLRHAVEQQLRRLRFDRDRDGLRGGAHDVRRDEPLRVLLRRLVEVHLVGRAHEAERLGLRQAHVERAAAVDLRAEVQAVEGGERGVVDVQHVVEGDGHEAAVLAQDLLDDVERRGAARRGVGRRRRGEHPQRGEQRQPVVGVEGAEDGAPGMRDAR